MKSVKNIKQSIRKLNVESSDEIHGRVLDKLLRVLDKSKRQTAVKQANIRRIIMKNSITKLAAAVVIIIIALLIGLNYFGGSFDIASVAWGEVARKVKEIQMFSYRIKLCISRTSKEKIELEIVMYNSLEHGMRGDSYVNGKIISTSYMPLTGNGIISVFPHEKEYMRTLWSEEQIKRYMESNNPRKVVKKFLEFKYKEIGRDQINGIDVEGIELNDPKFEPGVYESLVACLWVDAETRLPVRIKLDGVASGGAMQVQTVVDEFQWDIKLDAHDFEPNIPRDYIQVAEIEETLDNKDEEMAIQGLRMFAEAADGKYPSSLAFMTVTYEYSKAMRKVLDRRISAIKKRIREDRGKQSNLEEQKEIEKIKNEMKKNAKIQLLSIVQSSCTFYSELVKEDKDPAYYGDTVTAEDANAVLIRWKISDDEYRVIFGDLTAKNVTAESLAELENDPGFITIMQRPRKAMKVQGIIGIDISQWPTIKVAPGMPAEGAGVQSEDVVIRVNGKDVSHITTPGDALKVLRGPAGEMLSITVKRDEQVLDFNVERVPLPK